MAVDKIDEFIKKQLMAARTLGCSSVAVVWRMAGRSGGRQNPSNGNRENMPDFGVQKEVTTTGRRV